MEFPKEQRLRFADEMGKFIDINVFIMGATLFDLSYFAH